MKRPLALASPAGELGGDRASQVVHDPPRRGALLDRVQHAQGRSSGRDATASTTAPRGFLLALGRVPLVALIDVRQDRADVLGDRRVRVDEVEASHETIISIVSVVREDRQAVAALVRGRLIEQIGGVRETVE